MKIKKILTYIVILEVGMIIGALSINTTASSTTINEYKSKTLTDWDVLTLAIIKTESEFNKKAVGKTKDLGILQLTPIFIEEVNRILKLEGSSVRYSHSDAMSPSKSLEMFKVYQQHHNPELDTDRAIKLHNPNAGRWYSKKVKANMQHIYNYEQIRNTIINN